MWTLNYYKYVRELYQTPQLDAEVYAGKFLVCVYGNT